MKNIAIIVAGGSGQRMKSVIPKQFLLLQGKPVLYHTLRQFKIAMPGIFLILVLPKDQIGFWAKLCSEFPEIEQDVPHTIVEGGRTRFHSSQNAINTIPKDEDAFVAIHDGVRPMISIHEIQLSFKFAAIHGNAVLAVPSKDSVRKLDTETGYFSQVARNEIQIIQTPQIFSSKTLIKAFQQDFQEYFTDDASVVEQIGEKIHLVPGNYSNIKITTPEDLMLANILLNSAQ